MESLQSGETILNTENIEAVIREKMDVFINIKMKTKYGLKIYLNK